MPQQTIGKNHVWARGVVFQAFRVLDQMLGWRDAKAQVGNTPGGAEVPAIGFRLPS